MDNWIDVNDRLPEDHEQVLVAWPTGDLSMDFRYAGGWGAPVLGGLRHKAYTHWQPLPDPPRREQ